MATSMSPTAITFNDGSTQSSAGATGNVVMNVYTSSSTWTKPATVRAIKVTVIGGGGAGGNSVVGISPTAVPRASAAGGGGAGGTSIRVYPAPSIPSPQPFTVGGAGATSSFGSTVTVISATGGGTGQSAPVSGAAAGGGNAGVGSGGQVNTTGSSGFPGAYVPTSPTTQQVKSGGGGVSTLGGGANGVTSYSNGTAGVGYGGGGSGSVSQGGSPGPSTFPATGGAGAAGVVVVEEFY